MSDAVDHAKTSYVDPDVVQRLLKVADFTVLFVGALALFIAIVPALGADAVLFAFVAATVALTCMLAMRQAGSYAIGTLTSARRSISGALVITLITGLLAYLAVDNLLFPLAGKWLAGWVLLSVSHIGLTRLVTAFWAGPLARAGAFNMRIAIVGGGEAASNAIAALEASDGENFEIAGLFDDRYDERSPQSIERHAKLGTIAELAHFARNHRVDLIIVAIPLSAESRLLQMLQQLWELPVDIRISGQASRLKLSPRAYTYLGRLPLLAVFDRPLSSWGLILKDVMDKIITIFALIVLSPVMAVTALAIRVESKGPVIFRQKRYGFNNELVEVYKFRSMFTDKCDMSASKLVTRNDPRVTRVGRFIRKTSIDELPQLFNVLQGRLSLVGPRPHATQAKAADVLYDQVVDGYFARHKVKPGITGWAQINGWRGETDTEEKIENRVKFDLEYIDQWSLSFDLYIIARTPFALLKGENAF